MQIGPRIRWEFRMRDNGDFDKAVEDYYFIALLLEEVKSVTSSLNAVLISKASARNQKTSKKIELFEKIATELDGTQ
jgi:anionic cell wall polymer biosynthesis LytR-Cps2A-Psr (LCP) family protein